MIINANHGSRIISDILDSSKLTGRFETGLRMAAIAPALNWLRGKLKIMDVLMAGNTREIPDLIYDSSRIRFMALTVLEPEVVFP